MHTYGFTIFLLYSSIFLIAPSGGGLIKHASLHIVKVSTGLGGTGNNRTWQRGRAGQDDACTAVQCTAE